MSGADICLLPDPVNTCACSRMRCAAIAQTYMFDQRSYFQARHSRTQVGSPMLRTINSATRLTAVHQMACFACMMLPPRLSELPSVLATERLFCAQVGALMGTLSPHEGCNGMEFLRKKECWSDRPWNLPRSCCSQGDTHSSEICLEA